MHRLPQTRLPSLHGLLYLPCNPVSYTHLTQRNKFSVGETIEIMKPDGRNLTAVVRAIYDENGVSVESAPHPQQKLAVDLGAEAEKYDLLRRAEM